MSRIIVLAASLVFTVASVAFAQLPPQPPPPSGSALPIPIPLSAGNDQERAACHPDVMKFCKALVRENDSDVFAILGCLKANRSMLSTACNNVLRTNGQ